MAGVDFRAVRSQVPMTQVLGLIGFQAVRSSGDQLRGACPIHQSHRPRSRSFSVHIRRHAYRCFGCGASGNQLDLWAAVRGTDLYHAAIELCEKLHLDVPWIGRW